MAPVVSRIALTKEYLDSQKATGFQGLTLKDLKAVLRTWLKKQALHPSPTWYEEAVSAITAQDPPITVDWNWVVNRQGEHTAIDAVMAGFYDKENVEVPVFNVLQPDLVYLVQNKEKADQEAAQKEKEKGRKGKGKSTSSRSEAEAEDEENPAPDKQPEDRLIPALRKLVWRGSRDEFKLGHYIYWKFIGHDPLVDVDLYDPKIIVGNYFGDDTHEVVVTRFQALDIQHILKYTGQRLDIDENDELEAIVLEDEIEAFVPATVGVHVLIQELVTEIIFNRTLIPENEGYAVKWHIPGYGDSEILGQPLFTFHPERTPTSCWLDNIDSTTYFPVFGPPNALRIILAVVPYKLRSESSILQTDAERITEQVAEYLLSRGDGNHPIVKAIRACNRSKMAMAKGHTPKCWATWVEKIYHIQDFEQKVPASELNSAIRNKKITKLAIGKMLLASSPWIGQCLTARQLIVKRNSWDGVREYLQGDDMKRQSIGIERFINDLEKFK
ncbi:hypothetical protein B0H12DRAFT_1068095 [Mycena haematopus]|nr:hypothetical protein B0H12DRAFT_1068095 [Mycena haematopus]